MDTRERLVVGGEGGGQGGGSTGLLLGAGDRGQQKQFRETSCIFNRTAALKLLLVRSVWLTGKDLLLIGRNQTRYSVVSEGTGHVTL